MKRLLLFALLSTLAAAQSKVPTISGSPSTGICAEWGANGVIGAAASAAACGTASSTGTLTFTATNDNVTGTADKRLAVWAGSGGVGIQAVKTIATTAPAGTGLGSGVMLAGVVQSGGGTTGSATIVYQGSVVWTCDNQTVVNHWLTWSTSVAGECDDVGSGAVNEDPDTNSFLCRVTIANAGVGTDTTCALVAVPLAWNMNSNGGNYAWAHYLVANPGSPFVVPGRLAQFYSGGGSTAHVADMLAVDVPFRFYHNSGSNYDFLGVSSEGVGGFDFKIDAKSNSPFNLGQIKTVGTVYNAPDVNNNINSLFAEGGRYGNVLQWKLTGPAGFNGAPTDVNPGAIYTFHLCQDVTGGRTFDWGAPGTTGMTGGNIVPAKAGICQNQAFLYTGDAAAAESFKAVAPAIPITDIKTAQAAAISTTTLANVIRDSTYRVTATLDCDSTSAAATVNVTIGWTDPSNTAQTATLGSAVACTTLGSASIGDLSTSFRAKGGTAITYATAIANTPTYDLVVAVETLTSN